MLKKLQDNPILTLLVLVFIMLGFSIDTLPVSIMEARNFITAREMVVDGNWILTTMNGDARYEKPPLPTWFSAIFALIFGVKNILALRFPTLLFIAVTAVFTYLLSFKLLYNKLHALINGLIVISSFYVFGITVEAPWDIFTHGFMLIGILFLYVGFQNETLSFKNILLAGFFIGFSILSKGPISIYALLIPFLIAYGLTFKFKHKKHFGYVLMVLVIALIIGGWWYFYVRINDTETFKSIAERETSNWSSYNVKPFYYYWSFFTQSGLWTIPAFISLIYPYLKSRVSNIKAYRLSLFWTLAAVILLSLIPEKKSRYLMPVLIPLAINTGFYIEYLFREFKNLKSKKEIIPVYFNFSLIAIIALAIPVLGYIFFNENFADSWFRFVLVSLACIVLGTIIMHQLIKKNIKNVFFATIIFYVVLLSIGLPLSKSMISKNYNPISTLFLENKKQGIKVYGFNYVSPEMIWQFGDKIPPIKNNDGIIIFPKEDMFGMLANGISIEDQNKLINSYYIEKMETFDLNVSDPDSKKYNGRLRNDYYILTKK
jgi:4-amino-4-deoxy-L-arabinose transferase-like glycosyltransferase